MDLCFGCKGLTGEYNHPLITRDIFKIREIVNSNQLVRKGLICVWWIAIELFYTLLFLTYMGL